MSTPPPTSRRTPASAAVRYFVPAYLVVIGLVLLVMSGYLISTTPDEQFAAGLALVGGLAMMVTALAVVVVGRRD
jgi:hypothetical protein